MPFPSNGCFSLDSLKPTAIGRKDIWHRCPLTTVGTRGNNISFYSMRKIIFIRVPAIKNNFTDHKKGTPVYSTYPPARPPTCERTDTKFIFCSVSDTPNRFFYFGSGTLGPGGKRCDGHVWKHRRRTRATRLFYYT